MIERIAITQYGKIDNAAKSEPKATPRVSKASQAAPEIDKIEISDAGNRAREAVKFVQVAREMPEIDIQKISEIEIKMESPVYLKQLAKNVAENIADRIIEAIDARYSG
jgi:hypothetical protein